MHRLGQAWLLCYPSWTSASGDQDLRRVSLGPPPFCLGTVWESLHGTLSVLQPLLAPEGSS